MGTINIFNYRLHLGIRKRVALPPFSKHKPIPAEAAAESG